MHRSMMQVCVRGSNEAVAFYRNAFDASILCTHFNLDGTIAHAELDVYGQILAISEQAEEEPITGNTMMLCLHFGKGNEHIVRKIYDALNENAKSISPLGACEYSTLQAVLVDQFGVCWCIFV